MHAEAASRRPAGRASGLRLVILDDAPFLRDHDVIRPVAATFHRFAEAVVAEGPFERATYLIPVRDLRPGEPAPTHRPVDETRLRIVSTGPFRGAAGYLARLPRMIARNRPIVRRAVRGADLVWIKAPASNALLVAEAARAYGVPRFTYVAGRAGEVVAAQRRGGLDRLAAGLAASAYDAVTDRLVRTGPSIRLGRDLFTSLVEAGEIASPADLAPLSGPRDPVRIAWAGRVVGEKGLDDLVESVGRLEAGGREVSVSLIGDGPARDVVAQVIADAGLGPRFAWLGELTDRSDYLAAIRRADLFVLPSRAEGVPKVLVDAMAVGTPVIATRTGGVADVVDGRGWLVDPADPAALAGAIERAAADPAARAERREAGLAFAAEHTMQAQARRLVDWLERTFPALPWPESATSPAAEVGAT